MFCNWDEAREIIEAGEGKTINGGEEGADGRKGGEQAASEVVEKVMRDPVR